MVNTKVSIIFGIMINYLYFNLPPNWILWMLFGMATVGILIEIGYL